MGHTERIESMFGVYRFGVSLLISYLTPLIKKGLKSILLFGVLRRLSKVISVNSDIAFLKLFVQNIYRKSYLVFHFFYINLKN